MKKKPYCLFCSYNRATIFVAYAYNEKWVYKYLNEVLHPNFNITEYFVIQKMPKSWLKNVEEHEQIELVEEYDIILTVAEWEIIHNGYNMYVDRIFPEIDRIIMPVIYALGETAIYHWNEAIKELNAMPDDVFAKMLFVAYTKNHSLFKNEGTMKAFLNRLETIKAIQEDKIMNYEFDIFNYLKYT